MEGGGVGRHVGAKERGCVDASASFATENDHAATLEGVESPETPGGGSMPTVLLLFFFSLFFFPFFFFLYLEARARLSSPSSSFSLPGRESFGFLAFVSRFRGEGGIKEGRK